MGPSQITEARGVPPIPKPGNWAKTTRPDETVRDLDTVGRPIEVLSLSNVDKLKHGPKTRMDRPVSSALKTIHDLTNQSWKSLICRRVPPMPIRGKTVFIGRILRTATMFETVWPGALAGGGPEAMNPDGSLA